MHVVLRTVPEFPRLRDGCFHRALRRVLLRYLDGDNFRVVHISVQKNHLHMLVEASSSRALTRGMQSFAINTARAFNAAWGGRLGKVFAGRYHATQIKTARYARNALSYVLNNWRRHREDFYDGASMRARLDEFSSAIAFTGWTTRFGKPPPDYEPLPVSPPQTSLLAHEWQRFGRIAHDECPGPIR